MSTGRSVRRRDAFDTVAELYGRARQAYPQRLIDDLVKLTNLGEGCRVLEIASGTGQLSVRLAERGVSLVVGRIVRHDLYDLWLGRTLPARNGRP